MKNIDIFIHYGKKNNILDIIFLLESQLDNDHYRKHQYKSSHLVSEIYNSLT